GVLGGLRLLKDASLTHRQQVALVDKILAQSPRMGNDWLNRLREARRLLFFCARPAARIEMSRSLRQAKRYLSGLYHRHAAVEVRKCLTTVQTRLNADEKDRESS